MTEGAAAREAKIVDLTHDGQGVADVDGRRVFVAGALPGERVLLAPRKRRRRLEQADLIEVLEPSAFRQTPPCEYFGRCGGCALQHFDYAAQVRHKQHAVREILRRIAGVTPGEWLPPVTGPEWGYRRRARLGVKYVDGKGRVLVGFRERAAPLVTDMGHCSVLAPPMDGVIGELAATIGRSGIRRRLPQAEVAVGDDAAAIVLRVLDSPGAGDRALFGDFGRRHGIDVYLQSGGPGTVTALDPTAVRPLAYHLPAFGLTLRFEPTDFVQINAHVNRIMVERVIAALGVEAGDHVLDLYCGLGNFSLPLARRAGDVLGIEGEAGLVSRAARNARLNGIGNAAFAVADLSQRGWNFLDRQWDLVVIDPPRTGAEAVVTGIARMRPRRIAYVSCHPATLARDAKQLVDDQGYALAVAGILDMFPHTHHVEVMAIFERR